MRMPGRTKLLLSAVLCCGILVMISMLQPAALAAPLAVVTPGTEVPTPTGTATATATSTATATATRTATSTATATRTATTTGTATSTRTPSATSVPPTSTPVPPSATPLPPSVTAVRASDTAVPAPAATPPAGFVDLQLRTEIDNPAPQVNDTVNLTVNLGNLGSAPAQDVVIAVDVPPGLEFLGLEGWSGDWSRDGNRILLWVGNVNPYAAYSISLITRATGSGSLSIPASVTTSSSSDPVVDNNTLQTLAIGGSPAQVSTATPLPETNIGLNLSPPVLAMLAGLLLTIRALTRSTGARERLRRPPQ
jgi:uncharacterized repeat protein (TIGR01451 family)